VLASITGEKGIGLLALKFPPVVPAMVRVAEARVYPSGTGKVEVPLKRIFCGVLVRVAADPASRGDVKVRADADGGAKHPSAVNAEAAARVVARIVFKGGS
jgi:hypothetical protein